MIRGGCLCGGVRFEIARASGPFELCHCNRCRKASGSAFVPWLGALREDFRFLQGEELIRRYEAPLRDEPPPYRTSFCGRCGSPVPDPRSEAPWIEVHAGVLDGDPGVRPERHILVEAKSSWFTISDALPQLDRAALTALRDTAGVSRHQPMPRTRVQLELYEPIGPYSHAVVAGGQIFISGTAGIDPVTGALAGADIYSQTRQVLRNIQAILGAAGATLDDIAHLQVNLLDMVDFTEMNRAYAEFFSEPRPARTVLGVSALPKPGALLTMNAVAVRKNG